MVNTTKFTGPKYWIFNRKIRAKLQNSHYSKIYGFVYGYILMDEIYVNEYEILMNDFIDL